MGLNWRFGYRLTGDQSPVIAELAAGSYYETMLTSGEKFGFRNIFGPQVLVRVTAKLWSGPKRVDFISTYFKLAPLSDHLKIMGLNSRELATGLGWAGQLGGLPVVAGMDYTDLRFPSVADDIHIKTLAFGFGFRFSGF